MWLSEEDLPIARICFTLILRREKIPVACVLLQYQRLSLPTGKLKLLPILALKQLHHQILLLQRILYCLQQSNALFNIDLVLCPHLS